MLRDDDTYRLLAQLRSGPDVGGRLSSAKSQHLHVTVMCLVVMQSVSTYYIANIAFLLHHRSVAMSRCNMLSYSAASVCHNGNIFSHSAVSVSTRIAYAMSRVYKATVTLAYLC